MWLAMIKKLYAGLIPHVPPSVSPMIAAGRTVKKLHPDALTVFVGPCIAKKAEAREPDVAGEVDYVLTFQETMEIFDGLGISLLDAILSDDPTALVGLPLIRTCRMLRAAGLTLP